MISYPRSRIIKIHGGDMHRKIAPHNDRLLDTYREAYKYV
jgi:hypothetical protein